MISAIKVQGKSRSDRGAMFNKQRGKDIGINYYITTPFGIGEVVDILGIDI
jgi:butyrate kinase